MSLCFWEFVYCTQGKVFVQLGSRTGGKICCEEERASARVCSSFSQELLLSWGSSQATTPATLKPCPSLPSHGTYRSWPTPIHWHPNSVSAHLLPSNPGFLTGPRCNLPKPTSLPGLSLPCGDAGQPGSFLSGVMWLVLAVTPCQYPWGPLQSLAAGPHPQGLLLALAAPCLFILPSPMSRAICPCPGWLKRYHEQKCLF